MSEPTARSWDPRDRSDAGGLADRVEASVKKHEARVRTDPRASAARIVGVSDFAYSNRLDDLDDLGEEQQAADTQAHSGSGSRKGSAARCASPVRPVFNRITRTCKDHFDDGTR